MSGGANTRRTAARAARRSRGRALAAAIVLSVAAVVVVAGSADARCVTVGIDSISHTQCNLP